VRVQAANFWWSIGDPARQAILRQQPGEIEAAGQVEQLPELAHDRGDRCRAGKVVANLRWVVQLHTRSTRQGFDPMWRPASGTRTSDVGSGQGGSRAEHRQASHASRYGGARHDRAQWRPATATGAGKPATTAAFRQQPDEILCGSGAVGRVPTYAGQTPAAGVTFCPYSRWNSPPAIMLIFRDGVCRIITFWPNSVTVMVPPT
jgi:hypothetical protein